MKFDIRMTIDIDEEDNILPISEDMYEQTVKELIQDVVYDIDAEIKQIEVKQKSLATTYRQTTNHLFTSHVTLSTLTTTDVSHGMIQ